ncbi:MAG: arginine deiminase-related protein [Lysobacteraceae bacterium]
MTDAFVARARTLPKTGRPCARGAFVISPSARQLASQSATDNAYMQLNAAYSLDRAQQQHRALQQALSRALPVVAFAGSEHTPDDLFPNNVFAACPGRLVLGYMRHPIRQQEVERRDIQAFFTDLLGYDVVDLRTQPGRVELTGSMVIDRARGLGFAGLGERCSEAGGRAFASAIGLQEWLGVPLAAGEYHMNVVMSILASRLLVICPDGFADVRDAERIAACYAPDVLELTSAQKAAFAANCLSVSEEAVWMSERAADALTAPQLAQLQRSGFAVHAVNLDEIEKAGGSLRCCVAEIF